jgi:SAM-dependent methyltransferase
LIVFAPKRAQSRDTSGRSMPRLLRRLYEEPPAALARKAMRRFRLIGRERALLGELLASPKAMRVQWLVDFLSRYETILSRVASWQPLDFDGRIVLELGSGPLLGWGPLAVYRGARRYIAIDPAIAPDIMRTPEIRERYLRPLHKDLAAVYGPRLAFEEFLDALRDRVTVHSMDFLAAPRTNGVDIVLSNSCLEHVFPAEESIGEIAALSAPSGRFLHLVDFGNHHTPEHPFAGVYEVPPDEYFERHRRTINLLKPSDFARLFARAGARVVPYYAAADTYDGHVCSYWQRYDRDDLFTKAAIVAGPL